MAWTTLLMLLWPRSANLETPLLVQLRNAPHTTTPRHPLSPPPWQHGYKGQALLHVCASQPTPKMWQPEEASFTTLIHVCLLRMMCFHLYRC